LQVYFTYVLAFPRSIFAFLIILMLALNAPINKFSEK